MSGHSKGIISPDGVNHSTTIPDYCWSRARSEFIEYVIDLNKEKVILLEYILLC